MDLEWIATALGARSARRTERIQSLWSGYGELFRVALDGGAHRWAVVKWVRPPRAARDDVSNARKLRSYEVEATFYERYAERCDDSCRVAKLLASRAGERGESMFVLEDLDAAGFDGRTDEGTATQMDRTLAWLASFHARFLRDAGQGLWPIGTYWYLETRRDELAAIADAELRDAAETLAGRLRGARFQTIVHGDAKDANFCFGPRGVAAVDFQYPGRAPGIVDVAYLLYGRSDEPADGIDDARLDRYFGYLREALGAEAAEVEAEWRELYVTARLDFCRFLAGWRPSMWRGDARGQQFVRTHLAKVCY